MPRIDVRNSTRYWLDRQTPGLSLLVADLTTHEYATHSHDALLVAVTEAGGSEITASGVPDEAHRSSLLVVNPAEPHSSRMRRSRGWRYRSFYLMESGLAEVSSSLGLAEIPSFDSSIFHDVDVISGFLQLHRALEAGANPMRQGELFVGTFGRLVQRHGARGGRTRPPPAPRDRVLLGAVVTLMRERHGDRLTLDDLAAHAGLSQFQLIGLCRRGLGMTPHAYLVQIRLGSACHHLRRGMPIAEAAAASGFYDQSALTNHFKRSYGMTPLQYVTATRG